MGRRREIGGSIEIIEGKMIEGWIVIIEGKIEIIEGGERGEE